MTKKTLFILLLTVLCQISLSAQNRLGQNPDDIVGVYTITYEGQTGGVRVYRADDGTYEARVTDSEYLLVRKLKYNREKEQWDGAKMRDPRCGVSANATCKFNEKGQLVVRGQLLGIGKTIYWDKIQ